VKLHQVFVCTLALAGIAMAQTPADAPKIALVNMQDAIAGTSDGQAAEKQLDAEFAPRKAKLDEQEKEIADLQAKLEKGDLSPEAKAKLGEDIDHKTLLFNLANDGADGDLRAAQVKVLKNLAPKMIACIAEYARDKGYAMVFDISESDVPKMYGVAAIDITKDVMAAYEKKKR
jgi:Skp family chaperone for outer membrane proteins